MRENCPVTSVGAAGYGRDAAIRFESYTQELRPDVGKDRDSPNIFAHLSVLMFHICAWWFNGNSFSLGKD